MTASAAQAPAVTGRLRPDDVPQFRLAQLLMLLTQASRARIDLDLHRLAVADFASANPLLTLGQEDSRYRQLRTAGFTDHPLSNAAPGQRYVTRRERLLADLTRLISYGLVRMHAAAGRRVFRITDAGVELSDSMTAVYADAYRAAATVMLPRISRLRDRPLQQELARWLRADPVLFELLGQDFTDDRQLQREADDS